MKKKKPLVRQMKRRGVWFLRWRDLQKNRHERRCYVDDDDEEAAIVEAAKLADDLRRYHVDGGVPSWALFCQRYEAECLVWLEPRTREAWQDTRRKVEHVLTPDSLDDFTVSAISQLSAACATLAKATYASHLARLGAALRWAATIWPDFQPPRMVRPRIHPDEAARGRPITTEEYARMLASVPAVVGFRSADSWRDLLTGLWLSGLRIGEAMRLTWEGGAFSVHDLFGRWPMFAIRAGADKSGRARHCPMAPDFAEWLRARAEFVSQIEPDARPLQVFSPTGKKGNRVKALTCVVRAISDIGEAAGVVVAEHKGKPKFASAQDFRRSFGARWALRVYPWVLKELMRHRDIQTTQRYYARVSAEQVAAQVWTSWGEQIGERCRQANDRQRSVKSNCQRAYRKTGELGFEPRLTDPESVD